MLAGVLLDVIEAALPIDTAVNRADRNCAFREMNDVAVFIVENFDDFRFAESSGVMWLSAGSGIKRCAIEYDAPAISVRLTGYYLRVKFL